jgi:DNA-binding IclR family transcriptional regulator
MTEGEQHAAGSRPRAAGHVKSADRVLQILDLLGADARALPVTRIHALTGIPRSSLHQLLHTMAARGWLELSADGSSTAIGPRALVVGTSYLDRDDALPLATHSLELIRDETGYTTHYARLDGANVVYLATRETRDSRRAAARVGRELPAHATALGKVLLAELTTDEVTGLLPEVFPALTERTITDADELHTQLAAIRRSGHAREREENTLGLTCISVAVPYRIPATDAISCSIPLPCASQRELDRVSRTLHAAATSLAGDLRRSGVR